MRRSLEEGRGWRGQWRVGDGGANVCVCVCCKLREQICIYAYENYLVKETVGKMMERRQPAIQTDRQGYL